MSFSLATYNIQFNQAYAHLNDIFKDENPDIVCLQEVETSENNLRKFEDSDFKLADYTNSFVKFGKIYGVATYYNHDKFKFIDSKSIDLPQSFTEIVLILIRGINRPRTVLKTKFIDKKTNKKLTIYNVHFTPWATNTVRIKQVHETLNNTKNEIDEGVIINGDFNMPYGRKKLETIFFTHNFKEATYNVFHTIHNHSFYKIFTYWSKLDYIFYKNIKHIDTKKITVKHSDHYPIISSFELE